MPLPDFLKLIKGSIESDNDDPIDLLLAEPIGFDPKTYTGMSSRDFGNALASIPKKKPVNLLINTLGGRIDEGTAMHNMVMARGNVNTVVIGFAASMGAVIAQAGAKRQMMPGTSLIIHNPQADASGEQSDMDSASKMLGVMKDNLVNLFANRTGQGKKKISEMMDATTVISCDDAKKMGFCDEVIDSSPAWNCLDNIPAKSLVSSLSLFKNNSAPQPEQKPTQTKIMKNLTAALHTAGLLSSPDLTEEPAIVTNFNSNFAVYKNASEENKGLKAKVDKFEEAQKKRIEGLINKAAVDKLIKDERKTALLEQYKNNEDGLVSYISDLMELKTTNAVIPPVKRQGAPPVPPENKVIGGDSDSKIKELQASLTNASPSEKTIICRQIRELRGLAGAFTEAKA